MRPIKVIIADAQLQSREGLRTIIDLADDMEVVSVATNGEEACLLVNTLHPDIVLLDIQMPVMNGIEALQRIKSENSHLAVVILTKTIDEENIVDVIKYGANGYMLKDTDRDRMITSIRDAVGGHYILPHSE